MVKQVQDNLESVFKTKEISILITTVQKWSTSSIFTAVAENSKTV